MLILAGRRLGGYPPIVKVPAAHRVAAVGESRDPRPIRAADPLPHRGKSMKRQLFVAAGLLAVMAGGPFSPSPAVAQIPDFPGAPRPDPRVMEFQNITKTAKTYDGLFKLYQKDENLYVELQPRHLDKPLLCPIAVAKGAGIGGMTLNFDEQWVLLFKKVSDDKVHLIRRNVHNKARPGSPTARAVDITYSDSVLKAIRIVGTNPGTQGVLINLNDIFMSDFAELGIGSFDASRSIWHKVKAFPRNVELQIQATYSGGFGGDDVIDPRGQTVVIHYGLAELPDGGYQPRLADDRVGYFVTALKDFSSNSKDTSFVRYVNRWRLEPAEPIVPGKLSVPKRSIKFYIEKSVPHEFRAAVQEGILEWNKAFEKIGFRNAIEVVQQRDDEEFDPEDMNYNTFRWITTDVPFAIGPSRANPLTGEILDADILFDGSFVRYWKHERQVLRVDGKVIEIASPIQAMDMGWGLLNNDLLRRGMGPAGWNDRTKTFDPDALRMAAIRQGACFCGDCRKMEIGMASLALTELVQPPTPKDKDGKEPKKDDKEKDKLLDDLLYQAVKETVMHEVGHTLGLRHNFKASTMLPASQLHDTKITREKGLSGSVMDYNPVNIAPKGVKQGDFFSTTIGPYDYWAIEYGYKPLTGGTEGEVKELAKIAAKGAGTPGLDYGTDEDTFLTSDPHTNRWDLGSDVMKFAQDRMVTTEELLKNLATKIVDEGEGYQRARVAFEMLLSQYGNGAYLIAKYVGAEHANRDHKGDPSARDPLVPVSPAKQREGLKFLQDHIFSDKPFNFPPDLLRKLAVERWYHWGTGYSSTDFPLYNRVLNIQKVALNQLLSPRVLQRVLTNSIKTDKDAKPLTVAEIFRTVTDGVWSDLPVGEEKKEFTSSVIRRNLQREHLKKLTNLVLGEKAGGGSFYEYIMMMMEGGGGGAVPPDARSLARFHLRELGKRIDAALKAKPADADELVVAHLEECKERINKVLAASMQAND